MDEDIQTVLTGNHSNTPKPALGVNTPKATPQGSPQVSRKKKNTAGKSRVTPILSEPIDRRRQSIQYVLTAEERRILFRGSHIDEHVKSELDEIKDTEDEEQDPDEKSALTCVLLLMFEELEHQPVVYEKLLTSDLFDGCLKQVPSEQTELVRKILKNS